MEKTEPKQAMKELTMMLLYLSRFTEEKDDYFAWKGYDFDILNELDEADYIRQGKRPSRTKTVYITGEGKERAKDLLKKYGMNR